MLNADLALSNEVEKWERAKKNPKRRKPNPKTKKKKVDAEDEVACHFIAYVPMEGEVWRLDGLQRQPVKIGTAFESNDTHELTC